MKRIFSILLLFLFTAGMIYSEKIAAFPEIKKPQSLDVDKDRAYVVEGAEVFVYSLKNFKLLAKFGKRGEGPQEFRISPTGRVVVHPLGDYLYISSMGKMSKFTRDGKYISEVITPTGENYKPLWHNKFVGAGVISEDGTMYRTIDFYNENMVKGKTVFKHIHSEQKSGSINVFATARVYRTYDKKLFVTGREGLAIDVFDIDGKKLFSINHEYERKKLTDDDKNQVTNWFMKNPRFSDAQKEIFKKQIVFPEYYPAIEDIKVKDNKIYVKTFISKGEEFEFLIFNVKGKYLKTQFLHLAKQDELYPYYFDIANGKVYQVIENEDTETWELHETKI